jgi:ankyrin repeat protein
VPIRILRWRQLLQTAIAVWGLAVLPSCSNDIVKDYRKGRESRLCRLLREKNIPQLQQSLRQGADLNGYCDKRFSMPMKAMGWNGPRVVGENITLTSVSLLEMAVSRRDTQIAELLINAGANVNEGIENAGENSNNQPIAGDTSPLLGIALGQQDKNMAKLLLRKGAKCRNRYYPTMLIPHPGNDCQLRQ